MPKPKKPTRLTAARRRSLEANLFWAAQRAVEPWEAFRWHSASGNAIDAFKEHSSQALAIDVFGALKVSEQREAVLGRLAARLGLPVGGPWEVHLEWHDPANPLREKQPTWADAVALSPQAAIFFECKFTEHDGGVCSQTQPIRNGKNKGLKQCNGAYTPQTNSANGKTARCALTGKGLRYWEVIPEVFHIRNDLGYLPCPFAGPWFQWMRNLANAYATAHATGRQPAFILVYADGPSLPMAQRLQLPDWARLTRLVNTKAIVLRALSYQAITRLAVEAAPAEPMWRELAAWVEGKISNVCRARVMDGEPQA